MSKLYEAWPGATLQITFLACKEHILSVALNIVIASQVWARGIPKKDTPQFPSRKDISMPWFLRNKLACGVLFLCPTSFGIDM